VSATGPLISLSLSPSLYIYVCVCVCMYVCMYVCIYILGVNPSAPPPLSSGGLRACDRPADQHQARVGAPHRQQARRAAAFATRSPLYPGRDLSKGYEVLLNYSEYFQ